MADRSDKFVVPAGELRVIPPDSEEEPEEPEGKSLDEEEAAARKREAAAALEAMWRSEAKDAEHGYDEDGNSMAPGDEDESEDEEDED